MPVHIVIRVLCSYCDSSSMEITSSALSSVSCYLILLLSTFSWHWIAYDVPLRSYSLTHSSLVILLRNFSLNCSINAACSFAGGLGDETGERNWPPVVSPGPGAKRVTQGVWNFLSHKMMRNNTVNKVRVAATELPQLLSLNTNMFGEATAQSRCQTLCSSKVKRKN